MNHLKAFLKYPLSLLLCLLLSIAVWIIFYPGIYSPDSLDLAYESALGIFSDLHAVLMPFVVSIVLKLGGSFGGVICTQILLGFLGVRKLILSFVHFWGNLEGQADWIASFILILLALPLTPLSIYLATFWNDTWLTIFLIWAVALLIDLHQEMETRRQFIFKTLVAVFFMGLVILSRQNALVVYPFMALVMVIILRRKSIHWFFCGLAMLFPLVIYFSFVYYQYGVLKTGRTNPERAIYALDLASMAVYDPAICHNLAITSCDSVLDSFPSSFVVGNGAIDLTFNQGEAPHPFFFDLFYYPELTGDYFLAVREHPLDLAAVKLLNFLDYIRPDPARYFYQRRELSNELGLVSDVRFAPGRNAWFSMTDWVLQNSILHWFSYVHAVWLIVTILGLLICVAHAHRVGGNRYLFLGSLLLIPFSYYISYLIALTTSEFRFMFPSMLVMQVVTMTWAASFIARRWHLPGR